MSTEVASARAVERAAPAARSSVRSLFRWLALGGLTLFLAVVVQALRHPARLWSPGVMGRVLASGANRLGDVVHDELRS